MQTPLKIKIGVAILALAFTFCKKDKIDEPEPVVPNTGSVNVSYKANVDGNALVFGNNYKNANGDTFAVNMFKYYISNVVLVKDDGSRFNESKYHLINHPSTEGFAISGIPAGTYKKMIYTLGVDSIRNVSGVQDGDLSPSKGMFWDWNTGYIMLKLEGTSPQAGSPFKDIAFHIGGYAAPYSAIKTMTINFTQDLIISKDKNPQLKLSSNVNQLFKEPYVIDFLNYHSVTSPGLMNNAIVANYVDMISFESIVP